MQNWKTKITIFLTLFSQLSANVQKASENATDLTRSIAPNYQCKKPGYVCADYCMNLILCVDLGNSVYHAAFVARCEPGGKLCDAGKVDCSGHYCKDAEYLPFYCNAKGVFPHPLDCTQYYVCDKEENEKTKTASKCDKNKSYNAASGKCDLDMTSRACKESPVDRCNHHNQTGVIKENRVLFYICEVTGGSLVPTIYSCISGFEYNEITKTCTKPGRSGANVVFDRFLVLPCLILSFFFIHYKKIIG